MRLSILTESKPTGWILLEYHDLIDFVYLALADLQHFNSGLRFWLWEDGKQGTDDEAWQKLVRDRNSWCTSQAPET